MLYYYARSVSQTHISQTLPVQNTTGFQNPDRQKKAKGVL